MWFRKHIGLVNQEPVLFANTIADNISYGKDDATEIEVSLFYLEILTIIRYFRLKKLPSMLMLMNSLYHLR